MNTDQDYYATLGVLPSADLAVLRAAYKALAQRYHPDRYDAAGKEEATRRFQEVNEAYAVLSDPSLRGPYDEARTSRYKGGDAYFDSSGADRPPTFDPLEADWRIALRFYPELADHERRLSGIAWRLGYSYRAAMLAEKRFTTAVQMAEAMESEFLRAYFGSNPDILAFGRLLVQSGNKEAARALNDAVRVCGSGDPQRLIGTIEREHFPESGQQGQRLARHEEHPRAANPVAERPRASPPAPVATGRSARHWPLALGSAILCLLACLSYLLGFAERITIAYFDWWREFRAAGIVAGNLFATLAAVTCFRLRSLAGYRTPGMIVATVVCVVTLFALLLTTDLARKEWQSAQWAYWYAALLTTAGANLIGASVISRVSALVTGVFLLSLTVGTGVILGNEWSNFSGLASRQYQSLLFEGIVLATMSGGWWILFLLAPKKGAADG